VRKLLIFFIGESYIDCRTVSVTKFYFRCHLRRIRILALRASRKGACATGMRLLLYLFLFEEQGWSCCVAFYAWLTRLLCDRDENAVRQCWVRFPPGALSSAPGGKARRRAQRIFSVQKETHNRRQTRMNIAYEIDRKVR
jgi:hypothetical protein